MEAAHEKSRVADPARVTGHPLYSVQGVESRVEQELSEQLESALAFADFCAFLTSTRLSEQAEELVALARTLYAETSADLRRSRPR